MPWTTLGSTVKRTQRPIGEFLGQCVCVACAIFGLVLAFYLYFSGIVLDAFYSKKYMWNFSVTVTLVIFIFMGKLISYSFASISKKSTAFILRQFDSMCLGLAGLAMTLTNYHYDRSGYFSDICVQTTVKVMAAKLATVFYCITAFSSIFQYTSWLEAVCLIFLYALANAPLIHKICFNDSYVEYCVNVILISLCILTVLVYISNIPRNDFYKKNGFRQGCPQCDLLLFAMMTVYVYATFNDFCRRKNVLDKFSFENTFVSVWDTFALSTLVIMTMFCFAAFSLTVLADRKRGYQRDQKIHSEFGVFLYCLKRFLCNDIDYIPGQVINV
ncbi:uncharacterized protein LOC133186117 [Saccostrea echinata]|uniref:uncharacterized protein LOC133186117 n=1 Tax=Saccostrea echinata TaxID=191078 RepID=UPI002A83913C|nr:uncharacterized protein LOC133186117 [Saccostrea echinata]